MNKCLMIVAGFMFISCSKKLPDNYEELFITASLFDQIDKDYTHKDYHWLRLPNSTKLYVPKSCSLMISNNVATHLKCGEETSELTSLDAKYTMIEFQNKFVFDLLGSLHQRFVDEYDDYLIDENNIDHLLQLISKFVKSEIEIHRFIDPTDKDKSFEDRTLNELLSVIKDYAILSDEELEEAIESGEEQREAGLDEIVAKKGESQELVTKFKNNLLEARKNYLKQLRVFLRTRSLKPLLSMCSYYAQAFNVFNYLYSAKSLRPVIGQNVLWMKHSQSARSKSIAFRTKTGTTSFIHLITCYQKKECFTVFMDSKPFLKPYLIRLKR